MCLLYSIRVSLQRQMIGAQQESCAAERVLSRFDARTPPHNAGEQP